MAREEVAVAGEEAAAEGGGLLLEIVGSPLNLSLLGLCLFLLYQILRGERPAAPVGEADPPPLPKMKRRDFTLAQLRPYDGVRDPRILMAINGKVFDVSRARKFYGPVKYHHVGKLLKEGEEPTVYSDEEEKDAQDAKKD
ncbi:membrane-associated progesterone receptor component 1 isoform X2 [Gymnogyps californianus]|uniref:membrane-associated progesterone receptor component 1 isoform X2 n=1 Tax=Gymnogyps californianus TaxID=33616 RepID=UPI0021C86A31|nr:membrane-associated progesterone receptor component 1 isoform X2 [Gymnogyps californianus]